ncbi:MAG: DNA/RNA nuclease SfsA, partial [Calditrichaeota bacterium]
CRTFRPAAEIDPVYAETLKAAATAGVEILVYRARIVPPTVTLERRLDFHL